MKRIYGTHLWHSFMALPAPPAPWGAMYECAAAQFTDVAICNDHYLVGYSVGTHFSRRHSGL
jgi:hypothetical protein